MFLIFASEELKSQYIQGSYLQKVPIFPIENVKWHRQSEKDINRELIPTEFFDGFLIS